MLCRDNVTHYYAYCITNCTFTPYGNKNTLFEFGITFFFFKLFDVYIPVSPSRSVKSRTINIRHLIINASPEC